MIRKHFSRLLLTSGAALVAGLVLAQTEKAPSPRSAPVRDAYQGAWGSSTEEREGMDRELDLTVFKIVDDVNSASNELNRFRAERNSVLISNQGQIKSGDRARLKKKASELNTAHPGSFEGELAAYYAEFPAAAAYGHLDEAARLQPARDELLGPLLTQALRNDDRLKLTAAAKEMRLRGEVAPGLLEMAEDILLSVEPGAVLIVAGEMDGFPLLVRQFAEGRRPDVLLVDHRLLEDPSYRARIWQRAKARGAVPPDEVSFPERLLHSCDRPLYFSLALGRGWAETYADRLHITGLAMRLSESPCCDPKALEATWKAMSKTVNAGPLSRNYIIPAVVLLKHHRSQGDEERASAMEHEVRQLAQQLGITRDLQAAGILAH